MARGTDEWCSKHTMCCSPAQFLSMTQYPHRRKEILMIKPIYHINERTLAILPAKQMTYDSIVIEQEQTLHICQTPFQIIKTSCKNDWTSYEGRRQAVIHHMHFTHKVPIPISLIKNLYFFPTHSPHNIHNCWIGAHHIAHITKHPHSGKRKSIIQFKCGQTISLDVSAYTLQQQTQRTFACMYQIRQMNQGKITT